MLKLLHLKKLNPMWINIKTKNYNFLVNKINIYSFNAKSLEDKYGIGSVNIETGEFISKDPIPTGPDSVELPKLEKDEPAKEAKKSKKESKK